MVMLIVCMCLRFGCRDPQTMVNSIRCAMRDKRRELLGRVPNRDSSIELGRYLLLLRAWHNGLVDPQLPDIRKWLKLEVDAGMGICHYMKYDHAPGFTLCSSPCQNGLIWCTQHAPTLGTDISRASHIPFNARYVPRALNQYRIRAVGYFERRWENDGWKCSFDTMRGQMEQTVPDVEEDNLIVIRFFGFVDQEKIDFPGIQTILQKIEETYEWKTEQLTTAFAAELLVADEENEILDEEAIVFIRGVAMHIPLLNWRISVVYADQHLYLLVLNLYLYGSAQDLETALLEWYKISAPSTLVLRVGNIKHLVWLNTLMEKHKMDPVGFHLVFSDSERWNKCRRTTTRLLKVFAAYVAAVGAECFETPWYNEGGVKWMKGSGLYLTVTDRPRVTAPDGGTETMGTLQIYAEDFLLPIIQEMNKVNDVSKRQKIVSTQR